MEILGRHSDITGAYFDAFDEMLPTFTIETDEQMAGLLAAAEQAIEKGQPLTDDEIDQATGQTTRPGVDY